MSWHTQTRTSSSSLVKETKQIRTCWTILEWWIMCLIPSTDYHPCSMRREEDGCWSSKSHNHTVSRWSWRWKSACCSRSQSCVSKHFTEDDDDCPYDTWSDTLWSLQSTWQLDVRKMKPNFILNVSLRFLCEIGSYSFLIHPELILYMREKTSIERRYIFNQILIVK